MCVRGGVGGPGPETNLRGFEIGNIHSHYQPTPRIKMASYRPQAPPRHATPPTHTRFVSAGSFKRTAEASRFRPSRVSCAKNTGWAEVTGHCLPVDPSNVLNLPAVQRAVEHKPYQSENATWGGHNRSEKWLLFTVVICGMCPVTSRNQLRLGETESVLLGEGGGTFGVEMKD